MPSLTASLRIESPTLWPGLICVAAVLAPIPISGDVIRLKSGGEMGGKLQKATLRSDQVTLETLSGTVVTVSKDDLEFVTMRPLTTEEYETRVRRLPDTVDAHWEIADWCRQKALTKQRETHLRAVLRLDPQHEAAHRALGHVQKKQGWVDRDEWMTSQGYVKHKGKYITVQEFELIDKTESERLAEREWFRKVRLWTGWAQGAALADSGKQQEGWKSLDQIRDPDAASAVMRFLGESEHQAFRGLAVKILAQSGGAKPVASLVQMSLKDMDPEIRQRALDGIAEDQYAAAAPLYVRSLRHDMNPVVCRAGWALQTVGDESAVPALIDALVTPHNYQVQVPMSGNFQLSMSTSGGFATGPTLPPEIEAGLRTGQYPNGVIVMNGMPGVGTELNRTRVITVTVEQQNAEVLNALEKLTGKNFGYDERTWQLWWAAEKHQGAKNLMKS